MPVTIPGQGRYTVAESQAELVQTVGHTARTHPYVFIGAPVNIPFNPAGDYLAFTMVAVGELNQTGNQQLLALH
jgi:hypothetical protein